MHCRFQRMNTQQLCPSCVSHSRLSFSFHPSLLLLMQMIRCHRIQSWFILYSKYTHRTPKCPICRGHKRFHVCRCRCMCMCLSLQSFDLCREILLYNNFLLMCRFSLHIDNIYDVIYASHQHHKLLQLIFLLPLLHVFALVTMNNSSWFPSIECLVTMMSCSAFCDHTSSFYICYNLTFISNVLSHTYYVHNNITNT